MRIALIFTVFLSTLSSILSATPHIQLLKALLKFKPVTPQMAQAMQTMGSTEDDAIDKVDQLAALREKRNLFIAWMTYKRTTNLTGNDSQNFKTVVESVLPGETIPSPADIRKDSGKTADMDVMYLMWSQLTSEQRNKIEELVKYHSTHYEEL